MAGVSSSRIIHAVAAQAGISVDVLTDRTLRARIYSWPRQMAAYLLREYPNINGKQRSTTEIGRLLSLDHTTILHALKAVERRIKDRPDVADVVVILRYRINSESLAIRGCRDGSDRFPALTSRNAILTPYRLRYDDYLNTIRPCPPDPRGRDRACPDDAKAIIPPARGVAYRTGVAIQGPRT